MGKKKEMVNHLSRENLIKAAKKRKLTLSGHLAECQECRRELFLLRNFTMMNRIPLQDAPASLISRAIAIASNTNSAEKSKHVLARIIFDSWSVSQPVGVRGTQSLSDRRLRYEWEGIFLDLRAEKHENMWTFVAEAGGKRMPDSPMILEVDKKQISTGTSGLFQWDSKRTPGTIYIRFRDMTIKLPESKWKKPPRN
jgi:hypothetical protein